MVGRVSNEAVTAVGSFGASPSRSARHSWCVYRDNQDGGAVTRNEYPEARVEKILDVAERLFVECGYEHTTMI